MKIELKGVNKRFGDTQALANVSLDIHTGEVLALLGENGAGKSTLMKILYGFYQADDGEIFVDGKRVQIKSPRDAMALSIGMVFQQFNLIPALSVAENLMLSYPHAPWWLGGNRLRDSDVLKKLHDLAPDIDARQRVRDLAIGEQQLLELAKVLNFDAQIVILDEPTSVLTPQEAQRLWQLVNQLALNGHAVVFITHKMEDIEACADRVAIMRAGKLVDVYRADEKTIAETVALLMGEVPAAEEPRSPPPPSSARLVVRKLTGREQHISVDDINFELSPGEIFGIAGVAGNGQRLLADMLTGVTAVEHGEVLLDGIKVSFSAREAPPFGDRVAYIPEQPLQNGVAPELDLTTNLVLLGVRQMPFFPKWANQVETARSLIETYNVRPGDPQKLAGQLSGGNLQKLVSARELSGTPALVVACYPTMGLDLASTRAIYRHIFEHAERGACVIWISEDVDDLLRYAHRIAVLFHGRITGILPAATADRQHLGKLMTGARLAA